MQLDRSGLENGLVYIHLSCILFKACKLASRRIYLTVETIFSLGQVSRFSHVSLRGAKFFASVRSRAIFGPYLNMGFALSILFSWSS